MNRCSWTRFVVSIVAIGGLMMLLSQGRVSADDVPSLEGGTRVAQATPPQSSG